MFLIVYLSVWLFVCWLLFCLRWQIVKFLAQQTLGTSFASRLQLWIAADNADQQSQWWLYPLSFWWGWWKSAKWTIKPHHDTLTCNMRLQLISLLQWFCVYFKVCRYIYIGIKKKEVEKQTCLWYKAGSIVFFVLGQTTQDYWLWITDWSTSLE